MTIIHFPQGPSLLVDFINDTVHLKINDSGMVCRNIPSSWVRWFQAYANKKPHPLPDLDIQYLTPFTQSVLHELKNIPWGNTQTYSEVAAALNKPKAARAVGTACGKNPFPLLIPCHRVVSTQGLGGFSGGLEIKKRLLEHEIGMDLASSILQKEDCHDRNRNPKTHSGVGIYT